MTQMALLYFFSGALARAAHLAAAAYEALTLVASLIDQKEKSEHANVWLGRSSFSSDGGAGDVEYAQWVRSQCQRFVSIYGVGRSAIRMSGHRDGARLVQHSAFLLTLYPYSPPPLSSTCSLCSRLL